MSVTKVVVIGSTGMIGHQVFNYLTVNSVFELYNVSFRKKLQDDSFLLDARNEDALVKYIVSISPNYIINCVGVLINDSNNDTVLISPLRILIKSEKKNFKFNM